MKILILGGDGMLGHELARQWRERHEVAVTVRQDAAAYPHWPFLQRLKTYSNVDVRSSYRVMEVYAEFRPEAVVNAVGVIKQRKAANAAIPSLEINALLPHKLAVLSKTAGARLVQMSTDCVFSGRRGKYTEQDPADAEDLYGLSKYLGELHEPHCVTLRTSIIGTELARRHSLVEWFLAQRGAIAGYKRAIYTGFTTIEMARIIERVLVRHADVSGVWHVASLPISKFDLLSKLSGFLGRSDVTIKPDEEFRCDRSLSGARFNAHTGYEPPGWDEMLQELAHHIKRERGNC